MQVDKSEDIEEIIWRVDSKIAEVRRTSNSTKKNLRFDYDAMGNRIAKHIYTDNTFTLLEKSTYYVRDASGNVMAVYDRIIDASEETGEFMLSERHIYGSSRIGMDVSTHVFGLDPYTSLTETTRELGHKQYEISNHLGNVLSVITDQKLPVEVGSLIVSYSAVVVTATDYSPFGVGLYGRSWSGEYRYGFNGKEKDDNLGVGGYDFGGRIFEARLGRWLSIDPQHSMYPTWSVYSFGFCDPINHVDNDGEKVNWWRFRSAWILRRAMIKTSKGVEIWNSWKETSARVNLHVTSRVLTQSRRQPDGSTTYDIVEGLTVPRASKLGRKTNSQGIRAYNRGRHFKRDRGNNARPFFTSVDVFVSRGTKELEDNSANLIGSNNFHTIPRALQSELVAREIATGNYKYAQVTENLGSGGELNTPFGLINNIATSLPDGSAVGLNPNGAGGVGVPAATPNNNETNQEYLNRVGVHEGTHAINDPYESTIGSDPIRIGGKRNVWVAPRNQENVENDPCRNEAETIRQQRP